MPSYRLTPAESEALLTRAPGSAATQPLARLLAAVVPAAVPGPLAYEDAAVAAFRAARYAPAAPWAAGSAHRPKATRLLTAKAAAIGLAVAASGIALAAGTGVMPNPFAPTPTGRSSHNPAGGLGTTGPRPNPSPMVSPGPFRPSTAATVTSTSPGATGSLDPTASTGPTVSNGPSGTSPSSLTGLCRAYLAMSDDDRRRALTTAPFASLVDAAGGPGRVSSFCTDLLGPGSGGTPPAHSPSPHSGGQPAGTPTARTTR